MCFETTDSDPVNTLLAWCATNGVYIDESIRICLQPKGGPGIAVFSLGNYIHPGTILAKIPKDAVLSVRACSLSEHIPSVPYGLGAQLSLSLALYVEMLRQHQSKWYGYIQSLPNGTVDLPMFWDTGVGHATDREEALIWLTGTEAAKILHSKTENTSISLMDQITKFYFDIAEPLLLCHASVWRHKNDAKSPAIAGFYHAFSLVSSRAFLVDIYHGLSMVPVADAFNHVVENHVHLEVSPKFFMVPSEYLQHQSEYYVCPDCGSLQECAHDRDGPPVNPNSTSYPVCCDHDTFYEMVSNAEIPPNSEVFNTYGETLTNAQLLNHYSFILDINENDRLLWSVEEVLDDCFPDLVWQKRDQAAILETWRVVLDIFAEHPHSFEHSSLVYYESNDENICLNDEGKVSTQLLAFLLALGLQRSSDFSQLLRTTLNLFLVLEPSSVGDEEEKLGLHLNSASSQLLLKLAQSVVNLCAERKRRSGKPGSSDWSLSDLLEEIPETQGRTRLAILVLLSERSILDCCKAGWLELISNIDALVT